MSAHASAASSGATSSISRPQLWLGGGFVALLAFAVWLGASAGKAAAAECSNEAIRIAQGATDLPNCRAYEQVSPADSKGGVVGVDTKNRPMFAAIRADGDAATFGSSSAVGETERGSTIASNLARRTADGWRSFNVMTTTEPGVLMDLATGAAWPTPSADMSRMIFTPNRTLGPPNLTSGRSVYLSAPEGKGPPTWLSHWTLEGTQPNAPAGNAYGLGGAPDFSSGYFSYPGQLTDVAGDDLRTSTAGIYFFEGEKIMPAGVLPSGTVSPLGAFPAGSGDLPSTGAGGILPELARNQVSADGSKLFFVSPGEGGEPKQLYVEEGGKPARLVSHDGAGDPAAGGVNTLRGGFSGPSAREFIAATPDGSRVVFRSEAALTDDAPEAGLKTYRAVIAPGAITLTYLPAVDGAVLGIDDDASTIFFSIRDTVPGANSYYVWDEGRPTTPYAIASDIPRTGSEDVISEPVFSVDGDTLVFAAVNAEIEPGVPAGTVPQIFRWTKQGGAPVCISCRRDGGTPGRFGARMNNFDGKPTDNPADPLGARFEAFSQSTVVGNRKISSDGSRVFFDTNDPLDPVRDVNGTRDIYMWENGTNHLLTSGRGDTPSLILDSSASGSDVMLVTKDGLVPSDTNQTYDVYDVRVDGGFAEPVAEGCAGDACQGQGSGPRQAAVPGSSILVGAAGRHQSRNGKARSRKALGTRQLGRPGSNSARVRIQVPAAGKVSIAGADVKNKARRVKKRGAVVIAVGLSSKGKQKLAHQGQLKTTVRVTFRPRSGAATKKSMKLSFAGSKGAHR